MILPIVMHLNLFKSVLFGYHCATKMELMGNNFSLRLSILCSNTEFSERTSSHRIAAQRKASLAHFLIVISLFHRSISFIILEKKVCVDSSLSRFYTQPWNFFCYMTYKRLNWEVTHVAYGKKKK